MLSVVLPLANVVVRRVDNSTIAVSLVVLELTLKEAVRADLLANTLSHALIIELSDDLRNCLGLAEFHVVVIHLLHLGVRLLGRF